MKYMMKLTRQEFKELLGNPSIYAIALLPIIMSKLIFFAMKDLDVEILMFSLWVMFAQVMVGIMISGPSLTEEREIMTFDALLCTPLSYGQIIFSKGLAVLIFSLISQIGVLVVNTAPIEKIIALLPVLIIGAVLFIEIGILIGLLASSSKSGSAISAVLMIVLFLVVSIYKTMSESVQKLFLVLPSVDVSSVIDAVLNSSKLPVIEMVLGCGWLALLTAVLALIGKKKF